MTPRHQSHPDQYLVEGLTNADNDVIDQIYSAYFPGIRKWIVRNSGSTDDARDIFQEGLLGMYRRSIENRLTLNEHFGSYLFRYCKWLWLNELRKRKREEARIHQAWILKDRDPVMDEQRQEEIEREECLQNCFDELGVLCREILKLSWQGLSLKLISQRLDKSYGYLRRKRPECVGRLVELYQNKQQE